VLLLPRKHDGIQLGWHAVEIFSQEGDEERRYSEFAPLMSLRSSRIAGTAT
jgi:hypothetical protein